MPKIFVESKTVGGDTADGFGFDKKHLYLVFQNDDGTEHVIRGGPENNDPLDFGPIKTVTDQNIFDTKDNPLDASGLAEARQRTELDLQGRDPYQVWDQMGTQSNAIGLSGVDYHLYWDAQNSNSVVASSLGAAGFDISQNLPQGTSASDFPGIYNTLPMIAPLRDNDAFYTPTSGMYDPLADNPINYNNPLADPSGLFSSPDYSDPSSGGLSTLDPFGF